MYHRVAAEELDPWRLCVRQENFVEQLDVVRRSALCLPLSELSARRKHRGRLRLAITFDDGYRDNITNALPILERFELPATIFLVSDQLGSAREYWWDALERCVLRAPRLPAELTLELRGERRTWRLSEPDAQTPCGPWSADEEEPTTARQRLFLELWALLVTLKAEARESHIDALMAWSSTPQAPASRLVMSANDVATLSKHPLIEIGCHTAGHSSLPKLSLREQLSEIAHGRSALERIIGRPVTAFSYPFGHFARIPWLLVRQLGFQVACTSVPAAVTPALRRAVVAAHPSHRR